jgi:hypothetical protein
LSEYTSSIAGSAVMLSVTDTDMIRIKLTSDGQGVSAGLATRYYIVDLCRVVGSVITNDWWLSYVVSKLPDIVVPPEPLSAGVIVGIVLAAVVGSARCCFCVYNDEAITCASPHARIGVVDRIGGVGVDDAIEASGASGRRS